jgi:hypothetical protein
MWGSETFPIMTNVGSIIAFKFREDKTSAYPGQTEGWMDRVLGTFSATQEYDAVGTGGETIRLTFDLSCKRANPVF